jgi:hypothetical protein
VSEPAQEPEVRAQQIWQDNDPRSDHRRIQIVEVVRDAEQPYAEVRPAASPTGRRTRIRLSRFRDVASGYKLVSDSTQDPEQS